MVNEELKKTWSAYIRDAKKKGYRKETIKTLGMLALSKDAASHFGSSLLAFEHLLSLVKKYNEKETIRLFINELKI